MQQEGRESRRPAAVRPVSLVAVVCLLTVAAPEVAAAVSDLQQLHTKESMQQEGRESRRPAAVRPDHLRNLAKFSAGCKLCDVVNLAGSLIDYPYAKKSNFLTKLYADRPTRKNGFSDLKKGCGGSASYFFIQNR